MKIEKIKKFIKDHKKEIIFVGGVVTVVVAGVVIYKMTKSKKAVKELADICVDIANFGTVHGKEIEGGIKTAKEIVACQEYSTGLIELVLNDIKMSDLGNFGMEIAEKFPNMAKEGAYIGGAILNFNPTLM